MAVNKLADQANVRVGQNEWFVLVRTCLGMSGPVAETAPVMKGNIHVSPPSKQVSADPEKLCCYAHSCPADRICRPVSALGRAPRMVVVVSCPPYPAEQRHECSSSGQGLRSYEGEHAVVV